MIAALLVATVLAAGAPAPAQAPVILPNTTVSLRATTECCTTRYLHRSGETVTTRVVGAGSAAADKVNASWVVRPGLSDQSCVSFEARTSGGRFLRQQHYRLSVQPYDGTARFDRDATFCPQPGRNGQGLSFASAAHPDRFLRHYRNKVFIAADGGPAPFDTARLWADDVSWVPERAWTP